MPAPRKDLAAPKDTEVHNTGTTIVRVTLGLGKRRPKATHPLYVLHPRARVRPHAPWQTNAKASGLHGNTWTTLWSFQHPTKSTRKEGGNERGEFHRIRYATQEPLQCPSAMHAWDKSEGEYAG